MAHLTRFRPALPVTSLRSELDRMFHDMFGETDDHGDTSMAWRPRMDLIEDDDAYVARFDLPGMKSEDININFEDGVLSISGERKIERTENEENVHRMERSYGHFFRSFSIPRSVNESEVKATFNEGVLSIHLPKTEKARPRKIEVQ